MNINSHLFSKNNKSLKNFFGLFRIERSLFDIKFFTFNICFFKHKIKYKKNSLDSKINKQKINSILLHCSTAERCEVWFDHTWGGGTEIYVKRQFNVLKENTLCIRVQNNEKNETYLSFYYKDYVNYLLINLDEVFEFISTLKIDLIVLNNITSYFDALSLLEKITELKKKITTRVSFRGHDLFPMCPTVSMMNKYDVFCNINSFTSCTECFSELNKNNSFTTSIQEWHNAWDKFLSETVDEIIVFSKSTFDLFSRYYPKTIQKMQVIPHIIPQISNVNIPKHNEINICILGTITVNKGLNILKEIDSIITNYPNVNIIVFGKIKNKFLHIKSTGKYNLEKLPSMMEKNQIDIVFIPSVCPETFSYTTSEAMMMGLPVTCFNLGAPAERVKEYSKGLIIDKINGSYALNKIINYIEKMRGINE